MGMATITIVGKLGRDPESKSVGNGQVTEFSVAVDTGYGDRKATTWYNVGAWGKQGETIAQHFAKGDSIAVSGEFFVRKYGDNKTSNDVRLGSWSFVGDNKNSSSGSSKSSSRSTSSYNEDDEVPF
jgi:single-strand DNA-binding protein